MTQDLFAADSYGFTNALRWLMILMGVALLCGVLYTVIKYVKRRNAVAPMPGKSKRFTAI